MLSRVVQQPAHLLCVETCRATSGRRRSESTGEAMDGLVSVMIKQLAAERRRHAARDVVAQRHGTDEAGAVDRELLPGCKSGRHYRGTWVRSHRSVVIGLIGMGQHTVRQGSLHRAANDIRPYDGRDFFARMRARKTDGHLSWPQLRTRDHGGERIQDVMLGLFQDVIRKRPAGSLTHICAEFGHDLTDWLFGHQRTA